MTDDRCQVGRPLRPRRAAAAALAALALNLAAGPVSAEDQPSLLTGFNLAEPSALAAADQSEPRIESGRGWIALGDWTGLGRDTALLVGYQALGIAFYYVMPESISKWSDEEKDNVSFSRWWDNFQNPQWDPDEWYVNAGHAYFGAAYYIRARERGFGEVPSFVYAAFASFLYEFGIECFFERPSYQDMIITPVGGALLGAFVFEPLRNLVKAKAELKWYDHLLLVVSDPLGAANYVVERLLGIKSEILVDARPPGFAQNVPGGVRVNGPVGAQEKSRGSSGSVSVELRVRWY
jgi:Domain of unknown function (DUF3943)